MRKILKTIKVIVAAMLVMLALNIVSNQDIEYEHQRAILAGVAK